MACVIGPELTRAPVAVAKVLGPMLRSCVPTVKRTWPENVKMLVVVPPWAPLASAVDRMTSTTKTVPRTAATAFGVLTSI